MKDSRCFRRGHTILCSQEIYDAIRDRSKQVEAFPGDISPPMGLRVMVCTSAELDRMDAECSAPARREVC